MTPPSDLLLPGKQAANLEEEKKVASTTFIRSIAQQPNPGKASNREKQEVDLSTIQDMDDEQQALCTEAGIKKGRFEKRGYRRSSSSSATPLSTGETEVIDTRDTVAKLLEAQAAQVKETEAKIEALAKARAESRTAEAAQKINAVIRAAEIQAEGALKVATIGVERTKIESDNNKAIELARIEAAKDTELARMQWMTQMFRQQRANGPSTQQDED